MTFIVSPSLTFRDPMSPRRLPLPFLLLLLLPALSLATQEVLECGCNKPGASTLYIQGFVPANNEVYTSEAIVPAAKVACVEINSANPPENLLPDYCLHINFSDTKARRMAWPLA